MEAPFSRVTYVYVRSCSFGDIHDYKRKKKTLSDLLDIYGSVEGIDKNADVRDSYDYMFANTDNLINEVMAERNKWAKDKILSIKEPW